MHRTICTIIDTKEELSLEQIFTDLETGVTTACGGRVINEEISGLVVEYAQSKQDRPEAERALFGLIGQKGEHLRRSNTTLGRRGDEEAGGGNAPP